MTPEKVREEAARICDRIAGNTADFNADYRRAAGHCAFLIRQIKIEPDPFLPWGVTDSTENEG